MLGLPMTTEGVDLREALEPSGSSLELTGSPASSAAEETLTGTLEGAEHSRVRGDAVLLRGAAVGRYVVLGKLGSGAMGVVYTAHDPELDRKVALKLLRPRGGAEQLAKGRLRLLAEAQALARLSHPHVVAVHDVGEHEGQVFVAMEFVEGRTLSAWIGQGGHAWPEVLEVLVQAGRGLAAAHARDLVHRDFKPDNVMLGDDGRVRVMDFGLARAADGAATEDDAGASTSTGSSKRARLHELVLTVGMVGTPAYAAPEQLAGGRGGAVADQFSFCVMLWEALHGRRPFEGETLPELATRILAGELTEPPPGRSVPTWLRRIAERGLAVDPGRRWPSMDALLAALERGRTRARRRWGVAAAGLGVAAAAGAMGWRYEAEQRRILACEAEGATISEVWNEEVATELRAAMVATGARHAEVTAQKLAPWLEAQASAWQEARTAACLHAEVEGTWDADTLDRSQWCLDERRTELASLVDALRAASNVADAVPAAARLGRLEPCVDVFALSRLQIPPVEERDSIVAVRDELQRAQARYRLGAVEEGLAVARTALERAEAVGWPPLVATARRLVGYLLWQGGAYAEAELVLEQAFFEAGRVDAVDVAADAARDLAYLVGAFVKRPTDGLRWASLHELMLVRAPDPTGLREAEQLKLQGTLRRAKGEYAAAEERYGRVLRRLEQVLGPEHLEVANATVDLAMVYQDQDEHARSLELDERALVLVEQALGPDHPNVANVLNSLANDHRSLEHPQQAKLLHERALAIWEESLGPEHPRVAMLLNNLANVTGDLGELDRAAALHERVLAIREKVLGPEHPDVAQSLENLANVEQARELTDAVLPRYERALAIREKVLGPEHPSVAYNLGNLGTTLAMLGRHEEARARLERALRIWDATVKPENPMRLFVLNRLAGAALETKRIVEASRWGEEALRLHLATGAPALVIADSRFTVAQVRWAAGEDRAQALVLAEQARDAYREQGGNEYAAVIEKWIASRRPPGSATEKSPD
jgi:tetratricopeptide (TPR) repeat protein